ncbi:carboxypeptidase regulatory-like domain-containing protein [Cellulomonas timonensis]|uniref:carboxypeptidase regulatory-like domain-containing protein n=1 Tax=Cellulomonas timonensis TaxID=1689271 RepID=UPI00131BD2E3|nr:carboxypeptidase regulatory-like domain-containing protein [Cellulomonas timonensis]
MARTAPAEAGRGGGGSSGVSGAVGKTPAQALSLSRTGALADARTTRSADDGTWAFADLSADAYYLITFAKAGYQTQRLVMTGAEAAARALEIELVAGSGRLEGLVTGPGGPTGGAQVTITDGVTTVSTSTSTTGAVGRWSVEGLSTPSAYLVTVTADGLGAQSALVRLDPDGAAVVDLGLLSGVAALGGTVTGPDVLGAVGGLGGVTVTATDGGGIVRVASTVTDGPVGAYTLADLPSPGVYTVTFEGPGHTRQSQEVTLAEGVSQASLDAQLTLSSGVVQGTLVDPAGGGLAGAGITVSNGTHTYKTMSTSDAHGSFRLNGVEPGDYVVSAELFGHVTGHAQVTVTAGQASDADLVLTPVDGDGLEASTFVRGRVSDARTGSVVTCPDLPVADCVVTVELQRQRLDGTTETVTATSAPSLEYTIPPAGSEGLLPGLYTLTVSAPGYEPQRVDVEAPMGQTVRAAQAALLPSPSVIGAVQARVGAVPAGSCVIVASAGLTPADVDVAHCGFGSAPDGTPTCVITSPVAGASARCAAIGLNGAYEVARLVSGGYSVWVESADAEYRAPAPTAVVLAAGEVRRLDHTLDRLGRVLLSVLADEGAGALVAADAATVVPHFSATPSGPSTPLAPLATDAQGQVLARALEPGSYRFDVTWSNGSGGTAVSGSTVQISVNHNQELASQMVLTRSGREFQGRVIAQLAVGSASPVRGVQVKVTGIVGYAGLVPQRSSATVTTGPTGEFRIVAVPDTTPHAVPTAELPLVADTISVEVVDPAGAYQGLSRASTTIDDVVAVPLEVQPSGQRFSGTLTGVDGSVDLSAATLEVLSTPPGVGSVRLTSNSAGVLVWRDLNQPADTATGGSATLARPGEYRVQVSLPGYDTHTATVEFRPGQPAVLTMPLVRQGELRVAVVRAGSSDPVIDPVVTLTRPGATDVTVTASPGTHWADFGELPSGRYSVNVRAAGHAFTTGVVQVGPGQTTATPAEVQVARLGAIAGTVQVSIGGSLRALPGVVITATSAASDQVFTTTTDATGAYRLTGTTVVQGLSAGTWRVTAALTGYTPTYSGASVPVTITAGALSPVTLDVTMSADRVALLVDVYDPVTGAGVDGLTVRLLHSSTIVSTSCEASSPSSSLCSQVPGRYGFTQLEPGAYTLDVAGGNFAPLTVTVTVGAGVTTQVSVPVAARANTVQGMVSGQSGSSAATPLTGATVTLLRDGAPMASTATSSGAFVFLTVADGSYVLSVERAGYGATNRALTVRGGQSVSVDLTLYADARQVKVTVEAVNGFDLTGALVSLEPDAGSGQLALAAQPVVRVGSTTSYTTTFNQVPEGQWTAHASGPSGHHGVWSAQVGASADSVTIPVDEVRVRLRVTSADANPPQAVTLTVAAAHGGTLTEQAPVNGGVVTVYFRQGAGTVTAVAPSGPWTVSPTSRAIGAGATDVLAAFEVERALAATSIAITAPTALVVGEAADLRATVTPAPDGGTVTFTVNGVAVGTVPVSTGSGAAVLSGYVPGADLPLGSVALGASYSGTAAYVGSSASTQPTLRAPSATALSASPTTVAGGGAVTLTATVTSQGSTAGTVAFTGSGCAAPASVTVTAGQAVLTCTPPAAGPPSREYTATFTPAAGNAETAGSRGAAQVAVS